MMSGHLGNSVTLRLGYITDFAMNMGFVVANQRYGDMSEELEQS